MLLKDFIINCENKNFSYYDNKDWVDYENLSKHFTDESIPGKICEEWKNFDTSFLQKSNWTLPDLVKKNTTLSKKIEYENCIVLVDGIYNESLSNVKNGSEIDILSLEKYISCDNEAKNLIYNSPLKYSENRISGKKDTKSTTLLSLNTILNNGIVLVLDSKEEFHSSFKILNLTTKRKTIINPYLLVVCKQNSNVSITDISSNRDNNWINPFYEIYVKEKATLNFSALQSNTLENCTTGSLNFHVHQDGNVRVSLFNRENSKKDIRIFLKEKGAKAKVNGLLASSKDKASDVFCKVVHTAKDTQSLQNWRLLSASESKTSVIGKIVVNKGASKSDAKFFSKSLIINERASSFSKPELEIFEGDISCAHGASFGEIDKDKIFYLQSRGIKKKDAIKMLLLSFINEIGISDKFVTEYIFNEINYYL